jgi:hypothetical protein
VDSRVGARWYHCVQSRQPVLRPPLSECKAQSQYAHRVLLPRYSLEYRSVHEHQKQLPE